MLRLCWSCRAKVFSFDALLLSLPKQMLSVRVFYLIVCYLPIFDHGRRCPSVIVYAARNLGSGDVGHTTLP